MIDLKNTARYNAYTMKERLQLHEASLHKIKMEIENVEAFFQQYVLPNLDPEQDMAQIDYALAVYQIEKLLTYTHHKHLKVVK
jgi:hypothetical protein